mgnify:CR=1 FL=1
MAQFRSKPFGVTQNGDKMDEYIISNPGGLEISVLNYGCVIKNLFVPTKTGMVDVVVGHDTLADYEADFNSSGSTCCGAFVGRYANRIENAEFSLSGKTYKLEANNGKNHLHGTFPRKIYDVKMFGDTLLMETESPAGEDGFPGNLKVSVRYILTPDNTLRMDYRVSTDEDTIINLTNHTYFNLDGGGNVLGQKLRIYASNYLEGNNETCPTGKILPVDGTPMDFRTGKPLGRDLDTGFYQTTMAGGGFDHCYVLDRPRGASQSLCAWASSDKTGISMKMYTTQPGIQLYTIINLTNHTYFNLADGLIGCELDDRRDVGTLGEDLLHILVFGHIGLIEAEVLAGDLLDAVEDHRGCIVVIVRHDNVVAGIQELDAGVAADVACAAGNQNSHVQYLSCSRCCFAQSPCALSA